MKNLKDPSKLLYWNQSQKKEKHSVNFFQEYAYGQGLFIQQYLTGITSVKYPFCQNYEIKH